MNDTRPRIKVAVPRSMSTTSNLPPDHVFRTLPNVLASPHLGYVSRQMYEVFYGDTVHNIATWMDGTAFAR